MRVSIVGFDGYEIAENGAIFKDKKAVRINKLDRGYMVANLRGNDGKWRTLTLAALVLGAFVGPCPGKEFEARHIDGNPQNCAASNLRWEQRGRNRINRQETSGSIERARIRKRKAEARKKLGALMAMRRELEVLGREMGLD